METFLSTSPSQPGTTLWETHRPHLFPAVFEYPIPHPHGACSPTLPEGSLAFFWSYVRVWYLPMTSLAYINWIPFLFSRPVSRMLFGALTGAVCKPREISQTGLLLMALRGKPHSFETSAGTKSWAGPGPPKRASNSPSTLRSRPQLKSKRSWILAPTLGEVKSSSTVLSVAAQQP